MNTLPSNPSRYAYKWIYNSLLLSIIILHADSDTDAVSSFHRGDPDWALIGRRTNSNPFGSGCLRAIIDRDRINGNSERYPPGSPAHKFLRDVFDERNRVCNSDDGEVVESWYGASDKKNHYRSKLSHCDLPDLNYEEVRIAAGNWESSLVLSWIYQILLSEIFQVPTTIENGDGKRNPKSSFYDSQNRFVFPDQVYPVEHLIEANRVDGNCNLSNKACAHILPEVWDGAQNQDVLNGQMAGSILPEESNGVVGNIGYYISMHTAKKDPSLLSYIGLQGEENRKKLASTFKTPTTWLHYCKHVSTDNCTTVGGDGIALAFPNETEHENSYFVDGLYKGYFRSTARNNCTSNPDCVGHVATPHCSWTIFTENQMYHNNISLVNGGPEMPNGGYSIESMVQIWNAANATKSDVFFWWWTPEILLEKFSRTPFAFQRVAFPTVTEECLQYRNQELSGSRCSEDPLERIGKAIGSCDYAAVPVKKVMSEGLRTSVYSVPEARRSPAFDFLKQIYMPQYSLTNILRILEPDNPREAVCEWVYDNLETLLRYAPRGYPKDVRVSEYHALTYCAFTIAGIAALCAIMTAAFTYKWRAQHVLRIAQIDVIGCIIFGYGFLVIASFLGASEPSDVTCTATQWMIRLGYTLQFVPILIKVSAINKITRMGRQLRRVQIDPNRFKKIVALTVTLVVIYLVIWTLFDPSKRHEVVTNDGKEIDAVDLHIGCASEYVIWEILSYGWECILLLATTVLTFQSRDVMRDLNESHFLAFMVYSHFLFLLMRLATYVLMFSEVITSATMSKLISIFLSIDTIAAMSIYIWPKFFEVVSKRNDPRNMIILGSSRRKRRSFVSGVKLPADGKVPNLIRPSMVSKGGNSTHRRISGVNIPDGGVPNLIRQNNPNGIATAIVDLGEEESSRNAAVLLSKKSSVFSSIYMGDSSDDDDEDSENGIGVGKVPSTSPSSWKVPSTNPSSWKVPSTNPSYQQISSQQRIPADYGKWKSDRVGGGGGGKNNVNDTDGSKQELASVKNALHDLQYKYNLLQKENEVLKKRV